MSKYSCSISRIHKTGTTALRSGFIFPNRLLYITEHKDTNGYQRDTRRFLKSPGPIPRYNVNAPYRPCRRSLIKIDRLMDSVCDWEINLICSFFGSDLRHLQWISANRNRLLKHGTVNWSDYNCRSKDMRDLISRGTTCMLTYLQGHLKPALLFEKRLLLNEDGMFSTVSDGSDGRSTDRSNLQAFRPSSFKFGGQRCDLFKMSCPQSQLTRSRDRESHA